MKFKGHYQTMGVEHKASAGEIKRAYRTLAHQFHPDISDVRAKLPEVEVHGMAQRVGVVPAADRRACQGSGERPRRLNRCARRNARA